MKPKTTTAWAIVRANHRDLWEGIPEGQYAVFPSRAAARKYKRSRTWMSRLTRVEIRELQPKKRGKK